MEIENDPLKSRRGRKAVEVVELIKSGEEPKKAARKVGVDLMEFLRDKELSKIVRGTLEEWYYDDATSEATAKAALLELGLTAEDEKTRVSALTAVTKATKKERAEKGPATAIQIVVGNEVAEFIAKGDPKPKNVSEEGDGDES